MSLPFFVPTVPRARPAFAPHVSRVLRAIVFTCLVPYMLSRSYVHLVSHVLGTSGANHNFCALVLSYCDIFFPISELFWNI